MALDAHTFQQPLSERSNHYDISLIKGVRNVTINGGSLTLNASIETGLGHGSTNESFL